MTISAVVLTKNEEKNIEKCLRSLYWCDEIVVIDDCSQDKTVKIAQKMGVRVFTHSLNDDFAHQRNFGLEKAKGEWVLFVDADERIPAALAAEIRSLLKKVGPALAFGSGKHPAKRGSFSGSDLDCKGFYIKRRDFFGGRWLKYGETARVRLLRLAKKNAGHWEGAVHEVWKIKGKTDELTSPLLHHPHPTAAEFLEEINKYSTIRARELYTQEKKINFFEIIVYPLGKFLKNYFLTFGFLDGLPGFLNAIFMSFHSFLTRGKLWLIEHGGKIR